MRVFMLGWEFPPYISGGLGTACFGLTRALSRLQAQVVFVLPRAIDGDQPNHMRLLSSSHVPARIIEADAAAIAGDGEMANVSFRAIPSRMVSPYQSAGGQLHSPSDEDAPDQAQLNRAVDILGVGQQPAPDHDSPHYADDLIGETRRYARLCVALAQNEQFDVIHAHDWMTYPAGMAVAATTGKPLVVHVHSTEFDRSGEHVNQQVYEIERRGLHSACRVITVSYLTKSIVQHRYSIEPEKIDVIYNGIESDRSHDADMPRLGIKRGDRIVLFLGRITMQKGPEYFVGAAKKVLEKYAKAKFVMAGTGDMVTDIIELAAREGIGQRVLFTGFLRGPDVERIFKMADVYVMPSVSEPFGIAPLEAISHDVPVIISKTSGVAEVLTHALKVDFWDIDEIANKILAVLRHPPLGSTLRQFAEMEVRRLTWEGAAQKCQDTYRSAIDMVC
jgi:glycogen(starch) synthase